MVAALHVSRLASVDAALTSTSGEVLNCRADRVVDCEPSSSNETERDPPDVQKPTPCVWNNVLGLSDGVAEQANRSAAVGVPKPLTVKSVVLPTALPSVPTATAAPVAT